MMQFERFTERAQDAAMRAYEILQRYGHSQVDVEHLLLALLEQPEGIVTQILEKIDVDIDQLKDRLDETLKSNPNTAAGVYNFSAPGQVFITPRVKFALDRAQEEAKRLKDEYVSTEHIFLGILGEKRSTTSQILTDSSITKTQAESALTELRKGKPRDGSKAESRYRTLEKYSRDLTQLAREEKLDPVIGRDAEILRVLQVLSRRTKNNPVLIGEAGVGKTAIVEGLAQKIVEGDVPEPLMGKRVVSLDLGAMVAGARFRGEFEERLKSTIEEIQNAQGEIILFIDELHTVVGAGAAQGAIDASNMMKPALARGELRCIGATTLDEYHQYIERDSALERRFAPVFVEEPSVEETIEILHGIRSRYEAHHSVKFKDEALAAAARLSHRYVTDRHLPDKAIDLIDEAAAKLRIALYTMPPDLRELKMELQKLTDLEEHAWSARDYEKAAQYKSERLQSETEFNTQRDAWRADMDLDEVVDEEDIAELIASWTGIPVNRMMEAETEKLLKMEERLHERIVGQDEAITSVADAIRRARVGLKDPRRPIGSFIFLGPSGVGKTELARALAGFLFEDDEAMICIDMSEYQERHAISRMTGAPPGYVGYEEGGQLTEAVRRRPYQVILFDEIEKAHPDVWNSLLQILEDGRLTDGQGHTVNFRNTVIIMTSNIGTKLVQDSEGIGFLRGDHSSFDDKESQRQVKRDLEQTFRPEFLNRIDEIIIFHQLTEGHVRQIVDLQMHEIRERLAEQGLDVRLTDSARDWLAQEGYDINFGARPLRRTLQRQVESPLAVRLLKGEFESGDIVTIDTDGEELAFVRGEGEEDRTDGA